LKIYLNPLKCIGINGLGFKSYLRANKIPKSSMLRATSSAPIMAVQGGGVSPSSRCENANDSVTKANMNAPENKQNSPQTAEFLAWYEKEKAKGLVDVKFCPKNVQGATVESFFAEVNEAIKAQSVQRSEFF
jgi:hypothetical protein